MCAEMADGSMQPVGLCRQMVLFRVERRKAWRMLQSKAGIVNHERIGQQRVLRAFDEGEVPVDVFASQLGELIAAVAAASKAGDAKTPVMELFEAGSTVH